jgi:hypothetical protein
VAYALAAITERVLDMISVYSAFFSA